MNKEGYIAATRFGLGVRPDDEEIIFRGAKQWLLLQIEHPEDNSADFASLLSGRDITLRLMRARKAGDKELAEETRRSFKEITIEELRARIRHAVITRIPLYERLVNFWSNHFTVSVKKGPVAGLAGSFEREAIRPNVCGNFADMLLAVYRHPAMLLYLDNVQSSGPDSKAGIRRGVGLNENMAREIMELHTLGVDGGYRQSDVNNFAKILTGWGIGGLESASPGVFAFAENRHEPGPQTILDKTYPDGGEIQGIAALKDLAANPATAQHISFKLARHFIADNPPELLVKKLSAAFLESNGNLKTVYETLLGLPEAWSFMEPKVKSSYDLVISAARLCAGKNDLNLDYCLQSLKFLGNVPFTADSPAGFPDTVAEIAGPEAVLRRVEWAELAAIKLGPSYSYKQLANISIAPIVTEKTKEALSGATSEREGMALLLASPEFQKR